MLKRILIFSIFFSATIISVAKVSYAEESRKFARSTTTLFRSTPSEQIKQQEQTLIEQALQDKFESEFNYQDQYNSEYRWAARMKEQGLFDAEDVRGIAKNRAANRARKTLEHAIKGSDLDRGYKKLVKHLRKFRDYTTVKIDKNKSGKIRALHKEEKEYTDKTDTIKNKPMLEFYLQPDLNSGVRAVAETSNNIRFNLEPMRGRMTVGYQITF